MLPELLWVFEASTKSKGGGGSSGGQAETAGAADADANNIIAYRALKAKGSLPEFSVAVDHPFSGNPDPFLGHRNALKFFLPRNFGN
jgi:hypothetical protein